MSYDNSQFSDLPADHKKLVIKAVNKVQQSKRIGERFHSLVCVEQLGTGNRAKYRVKCDCGAEKVICKGAWRRKKTCGLCKGHGNLRHGHARRGNFSSIYTTWGSMVDRCTNPNNKHWLSYGGRGIKVHEPWLNFQAFLRDVGECPAARLTLERIDNNRGYEPGNVKWSTSSEQNRNRRSNRLIEFRGETKCLQEWSEVLGTSPSVLCHRLKSGWSVERTLTTPIRVWPKPKEGE